MAGLLAEQDCAAKQPEQLDRTKKSGNGSSFKTPSGDRVRQAELRRGSTCESSARELESSCLTKARNGNSALQVMNIMNRAWPAIRWTLDKLMRLAAAATALVALPIALFGGLFVARAATTSGLIVGLSIIVFGFVIAFPLLIASVAFWPDKSKKLKRPALVLVTMIYITGAWGLSLAGVGFSGVSYAKSHGLLVPTRVDTELFHRHS